MGIIGKFDCPCHVGNGIFKIGQFAQVFKVNFLGTTKVTEMKWFFWVCVVDELDCICQVCDGAVQFWQITDVFKPNSLANTKVQEVS